MQQVTPRVQPECLLLRGGYPTVQPEYLLLRGGYPTILPECLLPRAGYLTVQLEAPLLRGSSLGRPQGEACPKVHLDLPDSISLQLVPYW